MIRFVFDEAFHSKFVRRVVATAAMGLGTLLAFQSGEQLAQALSGPALAPAASASAPAVPAPGVTRASAPPPADNPFVVKSILPIDGPIRFGEYHWDERLAAGTGPLVITVDLEARVISAFRDGHEFGAAAILKGHGAKPTPTGVFPISEKDADHVSNIYDAPMPFMLRLTNDGVAIHGSKVQKGYATNGCIGVPEGFAKLLFEQAKLGDRVIVTEGKRMGIGDPIIADPATPPA